MSRLCNFNGAQFNIFDSSHRSTVKRGSEMEAWRLALMLFESASQIWNNSSILGTKS